MPPSLILMICLMPHSYSWLINRLEKTGKSGILRSFCYQLGRRQDYFIVRNRVFEYGYSYEEFAQINHAPLHSFHVGC